jgi:phage shock protein A
MFEYVIIALLSIVTIVLSMSLEKRQRRNCDLSIELENCKETVNSLTREYNQKIIKLSSDLEKQTSLVKSFEHRFNEISVERNHYKHRTDNLTKEVQTLNNKLTAQTKVAGNLLQENQNALLRIKTLEEQILFNSGVFTAEQSTKILDELKSEGTVAASDERVAVVHKPRRPRTRGNKQPR